MILLSSSVIILLMRFPATLFSAGVVGVLTGSLRISLIVTFEGENEEEDGLGWSLEWVMRLSRRCMVA